MAVTDPADARLLAALAEMGKAAVHELAAQVGMDPREVAYRLVALSGSGLPLLVGVESDPNGLRAALGGPPPRPGPPGPPGPPPNLVAGGPSGPHQVNTGPPRPGPPPPPPPPQQPPRGPVHGTPSGVYSVQGTPSGRYPGPPPQQPPMPPRPAPQPPAAQQPVALDPVVSTWGPPQVSSWARGDQPSRPPSGSAPLPQGKRTGSTGDVLDTIGLEGEQLSIQLLEVQDPADFLFSAAGYSLAEGERSVVVHTEITNKGQIPFLSLPDNYLELVTDDGKAVAKAPVSLTSRPPHRIGVQPGETAGGHTVYVLPDATRVVSVRWNARPEADERSLTWSIED
ncbi:AsnC family transcriptional regulator [Amycolatopsis suaedae]|uniref:AsnC family transcriptional regulator n=1 Tax=Amycolatopsis suaedae TaxID=2510978 RepID=A0A4Q7J9T8_9PSEU|nr:AsnC family transcriptional regulator [Amycolatopsis suaedae]RZQ63203.1 AsnC family transcriptional regulator [Amycolatopsis suaedae]